MLKSRIPEIIAQLEPRLDAVARGGAELIAERAEDRVSVATGHLREAIHVEDGDHRGEYAVVAGDTKVFYGHIVEHGGVRTPARPFLIPAVEESRAEILAAAIASLKTL